MKVLWNQPGVTTETETLILRLAGMREDLNAIHQTSFLDVEVDILKPNDYVTQVFCVYMGPKLAY